MMSFTTFYKTIFKGFLSVSLLSGILSCTHNAMFTGFKNIKNARWHKDSIVKFTFSPTDTLSKHNIYVNIRNNMDYEFSNLFLIVGITFPDNYRIVDTLEYEMTDKNGRFLGTGISDIKENKLEYKTNVSFPQKGEYTIQIQHAMRKSQEIDGIEELNGITDVGIKIENIN